MTDIASYVISATVIGTGATAVLDFWSLARKRLSRTPAPDYGLVGRWLAHVIRGRWIHSPIAATARVRGEQVIGWTAHYLIGIAFAAILLIVYGLEWTSHPTIGPALMIGVTSVLAPFLILQPGMGTGIAASRTPDPASARIRSLVTHTIFGIGLYLAGWAMTLM